VGGKGTATGGRIRQHVAFYFSERRRNLTIRSNHEHLSAATRSCAGLVPSLLPQGTRLEANRGMALRLPGPSRIPISCPRCGMKVKLTGEHERLVYYVCESCGTKGAFSVSSNECEFR
jgi:hypothetical protein